MANERRKMTVNMINHVRAAVLSAFAATVSYLQSALKIGTIPPYPGFHWRGRTIIRFTNC